MQPVKAPEIVTLMWRGDTWV